MLTPFTTGGTPFAPSAVNYPRRPKNYAEKKKRRISSLASLARRMSFAASKDSDAAKLVDDLPVNATVAEIRRRLRLDPPSNHATRADLEPLLVLARAEPSRFRSPESRAIANHMGRIYQHDEITIYERHATSSLRTVDLTTEEGGAELVVLCSRLLYCYLGAHDTYSLLSFKHEIISLCACDPAVHVAFRLHDRNFVRELLGEVYVYEVWSAFIGGVELECYEDQFSEEIFYPTLTSTLSESDTSVAMMVALEYLPLALALSLEGDALDELLEFWECFLACIEQDPTPIRWGILDVCFETIYSSGKPVSRFMSPKHLSKLAIFLLWKANEVPFIFNTFFAVPTIHFHLPANTTCCVELTYPEQGWDLRKAALYAVHFTKLDSLHGHDRVYEFKPIYDLPAHISGNGRGTPLERTIFVHDTWMAFYRVAEYALTNYRYGNGFPINEGLSGSTRRDLVFLAETSLRLLANNNDRKQTKEEARAAFYISQSVDIDRYCKMAVHQAFQDDTASINLLNSHSRIMEKVRILNDLYDLAITPQFENVPYLRRFTFDNALFIGSDNIPFPPGINNTFGSQYQSMRVDAMLLDGHSLVCLEIHGEEERFHCTGHYPILAGHSPAGIPLYVAAVCIDDCWCFTTIPDGAEYATYSNAEEELHTTSNFFVLALRHDPSDVKPPYPRAREGAMDPTGPLYWMELWPERDYDYFEDACQTDDDLLESFLTEYHFCRESERSILAGFDSRLSFDIR